MPSAPPSSALAPQRVWRSSSPRYPEILPGNPSWWTNCLALPLWGQTQIEQAQSDIPLTSAPWCYKALARALKSQPLLGPTTHLCSHQFIHASLSSQDSPLFPNLGNPQFSLGLQDMTYCALRHMGRCRVSHFLTVDRWLSITSLMDISGPFHLNFGRARGFGRPLTTFEEYCSDKGTLPQVLSKTYSLPITPLEQHHLPCIRNLKNWIKLYFYTRPTTKHYQILP